MPIAVTTQVHDELIAAYNTRAYNTFVLEGSSRSSKTYSIIQFLIKYAHLTQGKTRRVAVCRLKGTWLSATVLHDFLNVLRSYGIYDKKCYNKTAKIYVLWNCEFWFMGLDDPQKVHGFESDIFWINEAIEAGYDDYTQLMQRCKGFAILDYNPSELDHWIYDRILKKPTTWYSHSTFRKNQFISPNAKAQILSYEPTEENYRNGTADVRKWKVYGLGERASIEGVIFEKGVHWDVIKEVPDYAKKIHRYGLDFGYTNDVTTISDVYWGNNTQEVYVDEVVYKTGMLNTHIGQTLIQEGLARVKGYADRAEQKSIDEIYLMGVDIHPADKPPGSVNLGIDIMKRHKIWVTERSLNYIREFRNYTWRQDKNGKWLNEPVDRDNHGIDATRYVFFMEKGQAMSDDVKQRTASALNNIRLGGRRRIRR